MRAAASLAALAIAGGAAADLNCNFIASQKECLATKGCVWTGVFGCGNGANGPSPDKGSGCDKFQNNVDCGSDECVWDFGQSKCFLKPERGGACEVLKSNTICKDKCVWDFGQSKCFLKPERGGACENLKSNTICTGMCKWNWNTHECVKGKDSPSGGGKNDGPHDPPSGGGHNDGPVFPPSGGGGGSSCMSITDKPVCDSTKGCKWKDFLCMCRKDTSSGGGINGGGSNGGGSNGGGNNGGGGNGGGSSGGGSNGGGDTSFPPTGAGCLQLQTEADCTKAKDCEWDSIQGCVPAGSGFGTGSHFGKDDFGKDFGKGFGKDFDDFGKGFGDDFGKGFGIVPVVV